MKKSLILLLAGVLFFCLYHPANAQNDSLVKVWDNYYPGIDTTSITAISIDAHKCVVVIAWKDNGSGTNTNLEVFKYSPQGVLMWNRTFDFFGGDDNGGDVFVDANRDIYVTGRTSNSPSSSRMFLIKLSSQGNTYWTDFWENAPSPGGWSNTSGSRLAVDNSGNIYVTGTRYKLFPTYKSEGYLVKYNNTGVVQWSSNPQILVPANYLVFSSAIKLNSNGEPTVVYNTSSNTENALIVKYDTQGTVNWHYRYQRVPSTSTDLVNAITFDATDNLYLLGMSRVSLGSSDHLLVKIDASGNKQWEQFYSPAPNTSNVGWSLAYDPTANRIYTTGGSGQSALTLAYDNQGTLLWSDRHATGSPSTAIEGRSICRLPTGEILSLQNYRYFPQAEDYCQIRALKSDGSHWQTTDIKASNKYFQAAEMEVSADSAAYVLLFSQNATTYQERAAYTAKYKLVPKSVSFPQVTVEVQSTTGDDIQDGVIRIQAIGGNEPMSYKLNEVVNQTGIFEGLSTGIYTLLVSDIDGRTAKQIVEVGSSDCTPDYGIFIQNPYQNSNDGSISIFSSIDQDEIQVVWEDGYVGNSRMNLSEGLYKIEVYSNETCVLKDEITLISNGIPKTNACSTNLRANGILVYNGDKIHFCTNQDVTVDLVVSGGVIPQKQRWYLGSQLLTQFNDRNQIVLTPDMVKVSNPILSVSWSNSTSTCSYGQIGAAIIPNYPSYFTMTYSDGQEDNANSVRLGNDLNWPRSIEFCSGEFRIIGGEEIVMELIDLTSNTVIGTAPGDRGIPYTSEMDGRDFQFRFRFHEWNNPSSNNIVCTYLSPPVSLRHGSMGTISIVEPTSPDQFIVLCYNRKYIARASLAGSQNGICKWSVAGAYQDVSFKCLNGNCTEVEVTAERGGWLNGPGGAPVNYQLIAEVDYGTCRSRAISKIIEADDIYSGEIQLIPKIVTTCTGPELTSYDPYIRFTPELSNTINRIRVFSFTNGAYTYGESGEGFYLHLYDNYVGSNVEIRVIQEGVLCQNDEDIFFLDTETPCSTTSGVILCNQALDQNTSSLYENMEISLNGVVNIERDVTFRNCSINIGSYAEILLGGNELVFENCSLSTCSNVMWKGIKTSEGDIEFINSYIADAERAIHVSDNASLIVSGSTFSDNKISISIESLQKRVDPFTGNVSPFAPFSFKNSIINRTKILEKNNSSLEHSGIRIINTDGVFIDGESITTSKILDCEYNLFVDNSSVRIENMAIEASPGSALLVGLSMKNLVYAKGSGNLSISNSRLVLNSASLLQGTLLMVEGDYTFTSLNCTYLSTSLTLEKGGVYLKGDPLTSSTKRISIQTNNFTGIDRPIVVRDYLGSDARITGNVLSSCNYGISFTDVGSQIKPLQIVNNDLSDFQFSGITVNSTLGTKAIITGNTVNGYYNSKSSNIISLTNCQNSEISSNTIEDFNTTPILSKSTAIRINNSSKVAIQNNVVNNNGIRLQGIDGIALDLAPKCTLRCNNISDANAGIKIFGPSLNTQLITSALRNNNVGIEYFKNAVTGPQRTSRVEPVNLTLFGPSLVMLRHYSNENAWGISGQNSLEVDFNGSSNINSPFFVRTISSVNGYRLYPVRPVNQDVVRFPTLQSATNTYLQQRCQFFQPVEYDVRVSLSTLYLRIITGNLALSAYPVSTTQILQQQLYNQSTPQLVPLAKTNMDNDIPEISDEELLSLLALSGKGPKYIPKNPIARRQLILLLMRTYLEWLIRHSTNLLPLSFHLESEVIAQQAEIDAFISDSDSGPLGQMNLVMEKISDGDLAAALSLNNEISSSNPIIAEQVLANRLILSTIIEGRAYTVDELAELERLANLCPLEGGSAVYVARTALCKVYDTLSVNDFPDTCGEFPLSKTDNSRQQYDTTPEWMTSLLSDLEKTDGKASLICDLYPNPATKKAILTYRSFEELPLIIVDQQGKEVHKAILSPDIHQYELNLESWAPGIYFCRFPGTDIATIRMIVQ